MSDAGTTGGNRLTLKSFDAIWIREALTDFSSALY
jgi:aminopeptidase N